MVDEEKHKWMLPMTEAVPVKEEKHTGNFVGNQSRKCWVGKKVSNIELCSRSVAHGNKNKRVWNHTGRCQDLALWRSRILERSYTWQILSLLDGKWRIFEHKRNHARIRPWMLKETRSLWWAEPHIIFTAIQGVELHKKCLIKIISKYILYELRHCLIKDLMQMKRICI